MITALVIVAVGGLIFGGLVGYALGWCDGRTHALTRDYELICTAFEAPAPELGVLFDQDATAQPPIHVRNVTDYRAWLVEKGRSA